MKNATVAIFLVLLTGCSSISQYVKKGAELNDDALKASEFTICNAASIGAVKRRYNTPELVRAWAELCGPTNLNILEAVANEDP